MISFPRYIIGLAFVLLIIIALAPVGCMFADAFKGSFDWKRIFPDSRQLLLLKNSLTIAGLTVLGACLLGMPLAFLIAKTDMPFKKAVFFISLVPAFLPSYITTIGWTKFLNNSPFVSFLYGIGGASFIMSLAYYPFIMLLVLSGLFSVNAALEEAGFLLYPARKVFKNITLPLVLPYLFSGAIFVFVFSVSNYGVPDQLRVVTYPVEIFTQFSAFYDPPKATLLSLPIIACTVLLVLIQQRAMGMRSYVTLNLHRRERFTIRLGRRKIPVLVFCLLVFLLSSVIPLAVLVTGAGSLGTYLAVFKTAHRQIANSFFLACISATGILIIGFPLGYVIQRTQKRISLIIDGLSLVPFAVPATILGIGLIVLWNRPETNFIYKTALVVVFAHIARFIAFAVRIIAADTGLIPRNMEEQAALVCGQWHKRFIRILFPLSRRGFLYAWIACFALSIGELEATLLVTPAGEATLPIRIYTLLHYGAHKLVFGLCVVLIGLIFIPFIVAAIMRSLYFYNSRSAQ